MYADFIINGHFFFGSIDQLSKKSPVIISQTKVVQEKLRQVKVFRDGLDTEQSFTVVVKNLAHQEREDS